MFKVLIVDDEVSVLEGLAYTMPWESIEVDQVFQAESAQEALTLLDHNHVDIVITDIRMPGMNGLELIKEIRKCWSGIRCIILSGHGEFDYAREAIRVDTMDYLLKPIHSEELVRTVRHVQDKLRAEWAQIAEHKETAHLLNEHLPLLRNKLLGDLLHGRTRVWKDAAQRMDKLQLSFKAGDSIALLLVRLEEGFYHYESNGLNLLEYAVCNITEEVFNKHFDVWCYIDAHSYLVFAMKELSQGGEDRQRLFERLSAQLQQSVQTYLKGNISIMVSRFGFFPEDLHLLYEASLSIFRKRIGNNVGFFYSMGDEQGEEANAEALDEIYRLPTVLTLLESGKWEEVKQKLEAVFHEVEVRYADSSEHLIETFYALASSFYHFAHKNGKQLSELVPEGQQLTVEKLRSITQLSDWSSHVVNEFKGFSEAHLTDSRKNVLKKVEGYIHDHLSSDVSLQAIADYVHFHPVYLSKLYKQETGEALSEYIHRVRMEKAVYMLRETECKVYEIAKQIGYESTYFNKVFKKQFQMTPQEFRGES